MGAVADAAVTLETALKTVADVAVYRDPGANLATPALVLGPPSLTWDTYCDGPRNAQFPVFAVVDANEYAVERLWDIVEATGNAIDGSPAVVIRAEPTTYPSGGTDLPAYLLLVEMSL